MNNGQTPLLMSTLQYRDQNNASTRYNVRRHTVNPLIIIIREYGGRTRATAEAASSRIIALYNIDAHGEDWKSGYKETK